MGKNFRKLVILLAVLFVTLAAYADTVTLSTFYPSPYGSYQTLTVSDKLGIGTVTPGNKLHISAIPPTVFEVNCVLTDCVTSDNKTAEVLRVENPSTSSDAAKAVSINFNTYDTGSTSKTVAAIVAHPDTDVNSNNGALSFFTRDNTNRITNFERMRIDSQGRVGIGTTAPASRLEVNYNPATTNTVESVLTLTRRTSGAPAAGIGAGLDFVIEHDAEGAGTKASIRAIETDTANATTDLSFLSFKQTAGLTQHMRILSNGNVGIGIDTPDARLDVAGEVGFGSTGAACNAARAGQQRYNAGSMEFCDGGDTWRPISAGIKRVRRTNMVLPESSGYVSAIWTLNPAVDTTKSFVNLLGATTPASPMVRVELTNSTTVTASRDSGSGNAAIANVSVEVVEFN